MLEIIRLFNVIPVCYQVLRCHTSLCQNIQVVRGKKKAENGSRQRLSFSMVTVLLLNLEVC